MIRTVESFQQLKKAKNISEKKAILREAAVDGARELFVSLQIIFDKSYTFNFKSVPKIEPDDVPFTEEDLAEPSLFSFQDFVQILDQINSNSYTEIEIKNTIRNLAIKANILEWNEVYRLILLRKFILVKPSIINKVLIDMRGEAFSYLIPIWSPYKHSICKKIETIKGLQLLIPNGGERYLSILNIDKNVSKLLDIDGNQIINDDIINGLDKIRKILPLSIVLDGQFFNNKYEIFDIIALEDFNLTTSNMTQDDRHLSLIELNETFKELTNRLISIRSSLTLDFNQLDYIEKFTEFYDESIEHGYDSIIIKRADAIYAPKKQKDWQQYKR